MLEDNDFLVVPLCYNVTSLWVAPFPAPWRGSCILRANAHNTYRAALTTFDDYMLEEWKKVDGHLSDSLVYYEGHRALTNIKVCDISSRKLFQIHSERRVESHTIDTGPPVRAGQEVVGLDLN